jgi:hypothetical protein
VSELLGSGPKVRVRESSIRRTLDLGSSAGFGLVASRPLVSSQVGASPRLLVLLLIFVLSVVIL